MLCVGFRGGRGVLLKTCNSVKTSSLEAKRGLCAFVRGPIRLNREEGVSAIKVRGLFSKPPTGTQGLPKDVKAQNRTTLVSIAEIPLILICQFLSSTWHLQLLAQ